MVVVTVDGFREEDVILLGMLLWSGVCTGKAEILAG